MCFLCQAKMPADTSTVAPPKNIKVHHPDGRTVPVESVYFGQLPTGDHLWVATMPQYLDGGTVAGLRIEAEEIPPNTSLALGFFSEAEPEP